MDRKVAFSAMVPAVACIVYLCGCGEVGPVEDPVSDQLSGTDNSGTSWASFRQDSVSAGARGGFVVEGDMFFPNEEQVFRYWSETIATRRGEALTVNRVTVNGVAVDDVWRFPDQFAISYCVGPGFSAAQTAQLLPALDTAGQSWGQIVGVRYVRATVSGSCDSNNNTVVFDIQRNLDGSFFANSFPPSYARLLRTLYVDDSAFTTTQNGRTLSGILSHELGHIMGWRHEHIWTNATTGCTGETTANARLVTAQVDQNSVMYYPQCRNPPVGGYHITNLDYAGGVQLYGLAPPLVASIHEALL